MKNKPTNIFHLLAEQMCIVYLVDSKQECLSGIKGKHRFCDGCWHCVTGIYETLQVHRIKSSVPQLIVGPPMST